MSRRINRELARQKLDYEFPRATLSARWTGDCAAGDLSPHPAHDERPDGVQLADVPATHAAAPDSPQPARTYSSARAAMPGAVFAGLRLRTPLHQEGDQRRRTRWRRPADHSAR